MHFCHPVRQRPLVEIVRGPQTSQRTIAAAVAHVQGIARMPIVVEDGPGFVVNRLLFPYLSEALELLREGAPVDAIERAAAEFGMAMGPLRLMDEIGLDTILQAAWVLAAAFPERIVSSPLLVSMVKAGRLGRKTGAGFFSLRRADFPRCFGRRRPGRGGAARPLDRFAATNGLREHRLPVGAADALGSHPPSGRGQGPPPARHRFGRAVWAGISRPRRAACSAGPTN